PRRLSGLDTRGGGPGRTRALALTGRRRDLRAAADALRRRDQLDHARAATGAAAAGGAGVAGLTSGAERAGATVAAGAGAGARLPPVRPSPRSPAAAAPPVRAPSAARATVRPQLCAATDRQHARLEHDDAAGATAPAATTAGAAAATFSRRID